MIKNEEINTNLPIYGKIIILDNVKMEIWVMIEIDFSDTIFILIK